MREGDAPRSAADVAAPSPPCPSAGRATSAPARAAAGGELPSGALVLGLDFGGTKLAAGLVDPEGGTLRAALKRPTPEGGAVESLEAMLALARELLAAAPGPVAGVGINFGGPVDAAAGVVRLSHQVAGWEGVPLAARVEAALGLPAALENDANGQALAEQRYGAGRGQDDLVYLNLGTGVGGGVVLGGRLYAGAHGQAGEFGHMVVRPDGPRCTCGRRGCLEALCAGPAMGRRAREALEGLPPAEAAASALARRAGGVSAVTGRELTALAAEGDAPAERIMGGVLADLALGLANLIAAFDPGLIVLGGGAADWPPALFDRLSATVRATCLPNQAPNVRLAPAALGAEVGIVGGAAVWRQG